MVQPSSSQIPFAALLIVCLCSLVLIINPGPPSLGQAAQPSPVPAFQDVSQLETNKPVKREIALDQVHSYLINLAAGQYLSVMIKARAEFLMIAVFDPDGKKIVEGSAVSIWRKAKEFLVVAAASGLYRLEARYVRAAWMKDEPPTPYEIELGELRAATTEDRIRAAAQQTLIEAHLLQAQVRTQGPAEAWQKATEKALKKYQAALPLWRSLADRLGEAETLSFLATAYSILGEKQQALDSYHQAASLFRAMSDPFGESRVLTQIGVLHEGRGEHQEALRYYSQVIEMARSGGDPGVAAFSAN